MSVLPGDIVVQRVTVDGLDRAVVVSAPPEALVAATLLVEIACGRSVDSDLSDLGLTLGVPGMGAGRVRYRVAEYLPASRCYRVVRIEDPS